MSGLLGSIFSFGDSLKRNVRGLLNDPLAQIQRNLNQVAGEFNDAMSSPATEYARAGGVMANDPSTQAAIRAETDRRVAALMNVMPGGLLGATVWHGSPHKFAKFDSSKIGTGEGAQAYGHGLYLAESPDVAKTYMVNARLADSAGLNSNAIKDSESGIRWLNSIKSGEIQRPLTTRGQPVSDDWINRQLADYEDVLKKAKAWGDKNKPHLYKVDLPDPMIARMLDWDRPFSQQAPAVRKALQDAGVVGKDDWLISGMRGREIYNRASFGAPVKLPLNQADDQIFAAERLRNAGIPGIRYLDGGSRGAGQGTSNFVVFPGEEGLLTILERNGVPIR